MRRSCGRKHLGTVLSGSRRDPAVQPCHIRNGAHSCQNSCQNRDTRPGNDWRPAPRTSHSGTLQYARVATDLPSVHVAVRHLLECDVGGGFGSHLGCRSRGLFRRLPRRSREEGSRFPDSSGCSLCSATRRTWENYLPERCGRRVIATGRSVRLHRRRNGPKGHGARAAIEAAPHLKFIAIADVDLFIAIADVDLRSAVRQSVRLADCLERHYLGCVGHLLLPDAMPTPRRRLLLLRRCRIEPAVTSSRQWAFSFSRKNPSRISAEGAYAAAVPRRSHGPRDSDDPSQCSP